MTRKGKKILGGVCGAVVGTALLTGAIAAGVKLGNKDWKKITDKDSTTQNSQESKPSAAAFATGEYLVYE